MVRIVKRQTTYLDVFVEVSLPYHYMVDYEGSTLYGRLSEDNHLVILACCGRTEFEVSHRTDRSISIEAKEIDAARFEAILNAVKRLLC